MKKHEHDFEFQNVNLCSTSQPTGLLVPWLFPQDLLHVRLWNDQALGEAGTFLSARREPPRAGNPRQHPPLVHVG